MSSGLTVRTTTSILFVLPFMLCPHSSPPYSPEPTGLPSGLLTSQTPMCHLLGCSLCVKPFLGNSNFLLLLFPSCPPINPDFGNGQALLLGTTTSCNSTQSAVPDIQDTPLRKVGITVGITKSLCGQRSNACQFSSALLLIPISLAAH